MSHSIYEGGLHLNVEILLNVHQLSRMPPQVVTALMRGVADILAAKEYAVLAASESEAPASGSSLPEASDSGTTKTAPSETDDEPLGLWVRECRGHFHVTSSMGDISLPGDPFKTREDAYAALIRDSEAES